MEVLMAISDINLDMIKQCDENWHWNVNTLINEGKIENAYYEEHSGLVVLVLKFKSGIVRIDEYVRGYDNDKLNTIVLFRDICEKTRTIKEFLKKSPSTPRVIKRNMDSSRLPRDITKLIENSGFKLE
jgi:hypothetical protein